MRGGTGDIQLIARKELDYVKDGSLQTNGVNKMNAKFKRNNNDIVDVECLEGKNTCI